MSRWEPDARGRLERAALELYLERGYDQTTVAEIAQRAKSRTEATDHLQKTFMQKYNTCWDKSSRIVILIDYTYHQRTRRSRAAAPRAAYRG